jgi:preprotein translocase subunit SecE
MLGVRVPPGLPNYIMNGEDKPNGAVEKIKGLSQTSKQFYLDVRGEMKKVSWPSRDEVFSTTLIVIGSVFFFGLYLGLVDMLLSQGFKRVLDYFGVTGG